MNDQFIVEQFSKSIKLKPNPKIVYEMTLKNSLYFAVDRVLFIRSDAILSIVTKEVFADPEVAGSFTPSFISENSCLSYEWITNCEDSAKVGQALIDKLSQQEKREFCREFARRDGYGTHFAFSDENTLLLNLEKSKYYVFNGNE